MTASARVRASITIAAAALSALAATAAPALARIEGPWCAHRSLGRGFIENRCHMMTYEMCRAEIAGSPGTWCTQNPHYRPAQAAPKRRKAKRPR